MKELSEFAKGFLTGVIDGESCLYVGDRELGKRGLKLELQIGSITREFLERFQELLGHGGLFKNTYETRRSGKPFYTFRLTDREILKSLFSQLLPYLTVKREKAQLMLNYIEQREQFEARKILEFDEMNSLFKTTFRVKK